MAHEWSGATLPASRPRHLEERSWPSATPPSFPPLVVRPGFSTGSDRLFDSGTTAAGRRARIFSRRDVAASTQNQALNALLILYDKLLVIELPWMDAIVRAKRPARVTVVLTRAVLERVEGTPRLAVALLYGSGLRLLECRRLRVNDVDFGRNEIVVRAGNDAVDS